MAWAYDKDSSVRSIKDGKKIKFVPTWMVYDDADDSPNSVLCSGIRTETTAKIIVAALNAYQNKNLGK